MFGALFTLGWLIEWRLMFPTLPALLAALALSEGRPARRLALIGGAVIGTVGIIRASNASVSASKRRMLSMRFDSSEMGSTMSEIVAYGTGHVRSHVDIDPIAGLGNLLTDEILWRAGLDPARPAGSLDERELRRLHKHLRATLEIGRAHV